MCNGYLEGKCEGSSCPKIHPKACKWFAREIGCRRKEECDFSHDTLAFDDERIKAHKKEIKTFKCVSCQSEWKENNCVLQHKIDISALIVRIG